MEPYTRLKWQAESGGSGKGGQQAPGASAPAPKAPTLLVPWSPSDSRDDFSMSKPTLVKQINPKKVNSPLYAPPLALSLTNYSQEDELTKFSKKPLNCKIQSL